MNPGELVQPAPIVLMSGSATNPQDGKQMVVIRVESVNGSFTFPVPSEVALGFAEHLLNEAKQAKIGLIVPTGPLPPSNGQHG